MNKQLALIEFEMEENAPKNRRAKRFDAKRVPNAESREQAWWKLSNEERMQGLAGVRAIRAILENSRPEFADSLAKAS